QRAPATPGSSQISCADYQELSDMLERSGRLRKGLSAEEARSVLWGLTGADWYCLLVFQRALEAGSLRGVARAGAHRSGSRTASLVQRGDLAFRSGEAKRGGRSCLHL